MVRAGRVFVAGIHPSRTWTSGPFESVRWNACLHRLDLGLCSHPKEFFWGGNGVWTHVNSKGKIPSTGKCPQRRIEPATLWIASPNTTNELFRPRDWHLFCKFGMTCAWTKNVEKSTYHDQDFPIIGRNELTCQQHASVSQGRFCSDKSTRCHTEDRLVGLVVRRPPRERKIPGSNPACAGIFSGSSHTSDSKIGTPVSTLPGAWRSRVSAGTGRPGVGILWLGEVERWICNFYLSVAAHAIVWADPSLRYTSMLLGR